MATETATLAPRRTTLPLGSAAPCRLLELELLAVELTRHSKETPSLGSAATSQLQGGI